ncbi:N-acetyl-gamma-glutamyl-phosphate reductase [Plebeiibacterium sediminum]|uniref:N-acetyl-gamma-glutamyl-phosphate reductase n=1 Tax=Plebeiibacterium sediminum TaxID=2992112 RepID=A0AAE3M3H2_9BACT|nr:N-acetyl-gamma-glutamyl-phosphate reductase [Plebeiobacterium sediminum]MCW3786125.1 N-acetyl-gamma-glutamyl-phosphate reductase [Plebeiobacterium sediminum]
MIKVGIVGGAGYTAGELLRILIFHPEVEITCIQSTSNAGNPISAVHADLIGESDLVFAENLDTDVVDVIFLCMGHGKSKEFLSENVIPDHIKIIDLSHDYRLKADGNDFVYGLPELNREDIKSASKIANPGCFATAIQLALLPIAASGKLNEVHVNAITGSTGAGQKPTATSHFSWRNNNLSVYKAFSHQHLGEIKQSLCQLQNDFTNEVNFIPVRGNFARGIMATAYTESDMTVEDAVQLYKDYYKDHPFVIVSDENPNLKQVVNTNKGIVFVEKYDGKLFVISMIDNLVKGASGQAVQNMNLMFGLEETTGLRLKPVAF